MAMADDPGLMRVDMLGLLPLALNLAAAALRDTDASIADYMADLKELGADRYAEEAELSLEDYYAASLTPALEAQWRGLENDKSPTPVCRSRAITRGSGDPGGASGFVGRRARQAIDQKVDAGRAGTGQCMPGGAVGGGPDPVAPAGAGVRRSAGRVGTTTRLSVALCA
ncbi:MAG: hypothetical protein M9965_08640 [Anaerolineae bacterium]|nr:hypothetical protein [Anaerolineae bacterium]